MRASFHPARGEQSAGIQATLCALTIFLSAFLLFSVEPLIAKRIMPWFGGSAALWSVSLVFFQTALLAGYLYARLITRYLSARLQITVHCMFLIGSLVLLPIGPGKRWIPGATTDPTLAIFGLLTATVGVPFIVLSSTSPLLQAWLARAGYQTPYRMFAVSNFASLAALLAFPLLVEPNLDGSGQRVWWSVLYAIFAVLCGMAALQNRRSRALRSAEPEDVFYPGPLRKAGWFALSACGSMLLLSVTNHIDENVAAVPLLWALPLAIYLLSFVFSFGRINIYRRSLWMRLLAFALGILGYATYSIDSVEAIQVSLPIFLGGLFVCCVFCHGELNYLRPSAGDLTSFYLSVAFGGAAGAIFVGLFAPRLFSGIYELPITLIVTAALALAMTWGEGAWPIRGLWIAVCGCMIAVTTLNVEAYRENAISLRRSFYGSLRVVQSPHAGLEQTRTLFHGTIEHGAQFLLLPKRLRAVTYYGVDSGIGIVLRECIAGKKRVGVVGLGVGTLAAYGQPGDVFRYYEINSQVLDMARSLFFYLRESKAATEVVIGDARLSLEHDTAPPFDVLALDAFSGDAIPVHLLTREAMALYFRHMKPDGVLAVHVSNNYLDLAPVVRQLAEEAGFKAVLVHSHGDQDELILPADWVLVTNNHSVLENEAVKLHRRPINSRTGLRPWTDDYNNLLQVFRAPQVH